MAEGVVHVVVGQHPGLGVVTEPRLVPGALSFHGGVADPDLEGTAVAHVHHPAVGAGGHGQGTQGVGPTVKARWVVRRGFAGFFPEEGQSAQVLGQGQQGAHCALVELYIYRSISCRRKRQEDEE